MAKLAIAPPVEFAVNPVAAVFTVLLSVDAESVKAGAASGGVLITIFPLTLIELYVPSFALVATTTQVPAELAVN
jgi:hypothetical protein